jgi:hypothetical protein
MLKHLCSHILSLGSGYSLASAQKAQNSTGLRTVMDTSLDARPIAAGLDECSVLVADTSDLIEEVFRLHCEPYSLEKGYERRRDGMEYDEYDDRARHVLLVHRPSDQFVGAVCVIPSSLNRWRARFADMDHWRNIPIRGTETSPIELPSWLDGPSRSDAFSRTWPRKPTINDRECESLTML